MQNQKPTHDEWESIMDSIKRDLGTPVKIPKQFGEYIIDYFINVLPPILWHKTAVLSSEPYSHNPDGKANYIGFYKKGNDYFGVIATVENFKKL